MLRRKWWLSLNGGRPTHGEHLIPSEPVLHGKKKSEEGKTGPGAPGGGQVGRRVAAGIVGAFGAVMLLMSVVDAGVGGISEGGILIGAIALGSAYGLWPRGK